LNRKEREERREGERIKLVQSGRKTPCFINTGENACHRFELLFAANV
jgi:hypothetical protein